MDQLPLLLLFWYGILHAFGPDHLTAIADFSIGKSRAKTLLITLAFAIGHGVSLFLFAKVLESMEIDETILQWGDTISSLVIVSIGLFLLFLAFTDRINVGWHDHHGESHIHIWFGREHSHNGGELRGRMATALSVGALMGIGGVRGMLITLSAIAHREVDLSMVASFTLGVMVVFLLFGVVLGIVNEAILKSRSAVRAAFATAGTISVVVGGSILL
ncbi:MAG: hypothetical protein GXO19_07820 [Epsilonproteobacteria bacterium]|nr:hypothetical protein [Campylobacterota bacterium]NPA57618.1 hypothetical protein [Campylobacterota bacterium]